jgi:hypothetical protein
MVALRLELLAPRTGRCLFKAWQKALRQYALVKQRGAHASLDHQASRGPADGRHLHQSCRYGGSYEVDKS